MLADLGMHHGHLLPHHAYLKNEIPVAGVAHQAGTCRFGTDPATSVLNVDCRAHELDNLYVVDTSFFPSIGAVNPALTAMANALRVGDHLLERIGACSQPSRAAHVGITGRPQSGTESVIVGGGFGGMEAARRLKKANVEVTVVDRHNHLLFQPLIYQVAAGALSSGEVAGAAAAHAQAPAERHRADGVGHRRRRRARARSCSTAAIVSTTTA